MEDRIRQLEADRRWKQDGNIIRVGDVADRWLLRASSCSWKSPRRRHAGFDALADSGDIRVDRKSADSVDCETDSGDIEITASRRTFVPPPIRAAFAIRQVKGRVYASADSGASRRWISPAISRLHTDSGDILIVQTVAAPVRAESDSGGIRVKLAPDAGYNISCGDRSRTELE